METQTPDSLNVPSSEELHQALMSFFTTIAGIAHLRSIKFGPKRFTLLSSYVAIAFRNQFTLEDTIDLMSDFDEYSIPALVTIYEELIYISKKYERHVKELNYVLIIPHSVNGYEDEDGDPFSKDAVKEIDVVKNSVSFILKKLPKWAQRILEAIMEILKITRGAT